MQAALLRPKAAHRRGLLYPLLIIAAISVIIFSAMGAAALAGWLPRAESAPQKQSNAQNLQRVADSRDAPATCRECGVVASIAPVEVKGKTNGVGMIAGGVAGALVGNQIGRGNGNALATVGGAAGGAFAGNEVEKHVKKSVRYKIKVRMNDGTYRTTYQKTAPRLAVGDKVRINNGHLSRIG